VYGLFLSQFNRRSLFLSSFLGSLYLFHGLSCSNSVDCSCPGCMECSCTDSMACICHGYLDYSYPRSLYCPGSMESYCPDFMDSSRPGFMNFSVLVASTVHVSCPRSGGDIRVAVPWTHPHPFRDSCRANNQFHLIHTTPKQHSPKPTPADSKQKQTNPNPTEPTSYHSYSAVSKKI
jgi:hypothetical protein